MLLLSKFAVLALLSHHLTQFLAGDEEQISFAILTGFSVTAVITGIPSAGLLGSGILPDAVLLHR